MSTIDKNYDLLVEEIQIFEENCCKDGRIGVIFSGIQFEYPMHLTHFWKTEQGCLAFYGSVGSNYIQVIQKETEIKYAFTLQGAGYETDRRVHFAPPKFQ